MRVKYYILFGIWYLFSLLPFRILYIVSDVIYLLLYRVIRYRRQLVRKHLFDSFPEKSKIEIDNIERRFYHQLCDYFVELIKSMTISKQQILQHMKIIGFEELEKRLAEGQSCAVYLGHIFNWEWITALPLYMSSKVYFGQLYHALENRDLDQLLLYQRQRWGAKCIPLTDILRVTIENKNQKRTSIIGYLSDQVPHWNNIHHWCNFLNHDTPVMTGAERIIRKNNQAAFYLNIKKTRRGYYECELQLISHETQKLKEFQLTDAYHSMLEKNIHRQPELWLWSHNRWKRTREEFNKRFCIINGKVFPKEDI